MILEEYTREYLAILVERRINSQDVIDQLLHLFVFRDIPEPRVTRRTALLIFIFDYRSFWIC
jgi:hypothetical protein